MPIFVFGAICLSLIGAAAVTLTGVIRYKQLERDALLVLTQWQTMDTLTNDVLLKRVSLSDGGASRLLGEWERQNLEFSLALARFNEESRLAPLGKGLDSDVHGAVELWVLTERRISAAQVSIREMMRSGLSSRVMVNGFLSTFYRLRLAGLLKEEEIVKIDEIIGELEILDTTTDQFGERLKAVVALVSRATDERILRVSIMSGILAPSLGCLLVFMVLSYRRFRMEERRRRRESVRLRRDFLRDFFSGDADAEASERALRESGVTLPFRRNLVLCFFRYDRPSDGRNARTLERLMTGLELVAGPERELFPIDGDTVAALVDAEAGEESVRRFVTDARDGMESEGDTVSIALSERFDGYEGGMAFERLRSLFAYRYIHGPRAHLEEALVLPLPEREYAYPGDMEELIVKRILEGNLEEVRRRIDETLAEASAYSPATVRAVVARLSTTLFSGIERLERAAAFTLPSASADSLADIVLLDTVGYARERFARLLEEIGTLLKLHQGQRLNEQVERVDSIIKADFADPNLSMEIIADRLSLSAGYIGRVYRRMKGKSVADAINDARIEAAKGKLEDSEATIEAIAAEVGIANPGSFYRLFKARVGLTPAEYREKARLPSALR